MCYVNPSAFTVVFHDFGSIAQQFLREPREKHDVEDTVFLVYHVQHLATVLQRVEVLFQLIRRRNWNAVKRVFPKLK